MSLELETLDQLLGGMMSLATIRRVYPDDQSFLDGVAGLLSSHDVYLVLRSTAVVEWQWRPMFRDGSTLNQLDDLQLALTEQGSRRIS